MSLKLRSRADPEEQQDTCEDAEETQSGKVNDEVLLTYDRLHCVAPGIEGSGLCIHG